MRIFFLLCVVLIGLQSASWAQSKAESEIRKLEQLEIASILKGDTTTSVKLWAKDFVCNNPYGVVVTVPQILKFIKAGEIVYSTTERIVERVTLTQNIAIAMGHEVVKLQNNTPNAGKTITMRYTHTWLKTKGVWHLQARQATNFIIE